MRPIRRLLVANRGEIARRVIRAAHALGMATVAVYSETDEAAPFVAEADSAIALGGRTAGESYLDIGRLLAAARRTGCDAVHPGYGFLSESAAFARAVREAGLVFVGPSPEAIELLGDKLAAGRQAAAAGVPVLAAVEAAPGKEPTGLAFPAMVKAAAGGGGRGMRLVRDPAELPEAIESARREAGAAFGDDRVFVEPYVGRARHVEIQLFGDSRGNVVHCFERECSVQRRHQKVLEEAPSSALSSELRQEMGEAALRLARAVGYENAGTVEFLLAPDGRFYFLEVNTRIQVEHPVTEAVTGLDLVQEQLAVAAGEALSFSQGDLALDGHAIEARLYAEDPANGFLPSGGRVEVWRPAEAEGVRFDSAVESGSAVAIEFDPLLAKVIAWAPDRARAASRLARALEETSLHGPVNNRDFLVSLLRHPAFLAGDTTTGFLDEHEVLPRRPERGEVALACIVAALSAEQEARAAAPVLGSLPSGWRMSVMPPERRSYLVGGEEASVTYRRVRHGSYSVECAAGDDSYRHEVHRETKSASEPALSIDGLRVQARVARSGERVFVDLAGGPSLELREQARFPAPALAQAPGTLLAPMPGNVLSVHVSAGEEVVAGQLLIVVEAMKMEHRVAAPHAGRVADLPTAPGRQVMGGDLLVVIEPGGDEETPA